MELPTEKRKLPPGVRFHPTNAELLLYFLRRMVSGKPPEPGFVAEVDIYKFHPAALKALAYFSEELNWYFFCSAGKKYKSGERKKRSTPCGFWKPTGNDRVVLHERMAVGKIKTLVFHEGNPAKGVRTDWVMHEYRLEPSLLKAAQLKAAKLGNDGESTEFVVCKIFDKGGLGSRNGEQFGSAYNEEEWDPASADANTTIVEQVQSDVVLLSVVNASNGANANDASTSNGVAYDAHPSHANPVAAPEIALSSRDPAGDPFCDKWWHDDFFDGLDDLVPLDATNEQFHIDEMFSAAEFGAPPINLADHPRTSFDEFDM